MGLLLRLVSFGFASLDLLELYFALALYFSLWERFCLSLDNWLSLLFRVIISISQIGYLFKRTLFSLLCLSRYLILPLLLIWTRLSKSFFQTLCQASFFLG